MARILIVTNGKQRLRSSIEALRFDGHRVIPREVVTPVDVLRMAPDLLVIAPGEPERVRTLVAALRGDTTLRLVPMIVAGVEGDPHALLPPIAAAAADTVVLPAPLDDAALFDATHFFISTTAEPRHVA